MQKFIKENFYQIIHYMLAINIGVNAWILLRGMFGRIDRLTNGINYVDPNFFKVAESLLLGLWGYTFKLFVAVLAFYLVPKIAKFFLTEVA